MNIASALIKQIIACQDSETWSFLKKHYLPAEYHNIYSVISKHCDRSQGLPTFEQLGFEIRDSRTREQLHAIQALEVDSEPYQLLEYLKNEYTQTEILKSLTDYVENSVAFEDASEALSHLHQIVLDIETKVDLEDPEEDMQRANLFTSEESLARYVKLGLNNEFDESYQFAPGDFVMFGGRRGAGKSLTCANIAAHHYNQGSSAIYFTIEMDSRSIMQRCCAISTGVPAEALRTRRLSYQQWELVAKWWANRYYNGEKYFEEYLDHRDFNRMHETLVSHCILKPENQIDIVYDSGLTLGRIRAELDKKVKPLGASVIVVDYINQVKRSEYSVAREGQYDWKEQIEISKALKKMAQDYEAVVVSPYQIDSTGVARFSKGLLDAPDAAFILNPWTKEDKCVTFKCDKMRSSNDEVEFTSMMDWDTLRMGPDSVLSPEERSTESDEPIDDL